MARRVHARQHDTVDAICYRVFGHTAGLTEQTLAANPGLADAGAVLAEGTPVELPDAPIDNTQQQVTQLWD